MAVSGSAKEHWQFRTTNYNGGVWTAQRGWLVETTAITDREDTVSTAVGLPAYGELHPNPISANMYCTEISYAPWEAKTPMAWKVLAKYSSERTINSESGDPDDDEVLISFSAEVYSEEVIRDLDGRAIMNSADDPFDPPLTADRAQLIIQISSNHQAIPNWVLTYQNAVNAGQFNASGLTVPALLARVTRISVGQREKRGNQTFFPLTTEINIRDDGWHLEPLDMGFNEILLSKKRPILVGDDLHPTTVPQPLKADGEFDEDATELTARTLDFKVYNELDFTVLPGLT